VDATPVLSLTVIPALVAIFLRGRVREKENVIVRFVKRAYEPTLRASLRGRLVVVPVAAVLFLLSLLLFARLGQEFVPTLHEQDIATHAMRIPSTGITQSTAMQSEVERAVSRIPEVQFVFSKTGTAEVASDPMPPNVSDTFIILKPPHQWRSDAELDELIEQRQRELEALSTHEAHGEHEDEHAHGAKPAASPAGSSNRKARLTRLIELTVKTLPGNNYEFTQPIQMRFNELISGVRSDVAVKVYGDDFAQMQHTANQIAGVLRDVRGAADVKVEPTEGLPMMNVTIDRAAISRYGIRRTGSTRPASCRSNRSRRSKPSRGRTRSAARTASAASSCRQCPRPRYRLVRRRRSAKDRRPGENLRR
jgi:cobalt-zinc-cadmium resistance protein CzcA